MKGPLASAALAALLLAGAAPARAGDDGWVVLKNDSETVEITVPPGFTEVEIKNPNRVIQIQYSGDPYLSMQVKVYGHQGQNQLEHYVKFATKDVGSSEPVFLDGSATRFTEERLGSDGTPWISFCDVKVMEQFGYYIEILVPRDIFEQKRADLDRLIDSFTPHAAPQDKFTLPPKWKKVQNDLFAVLGPVDELPEASARGALENRLFRVSTWLDAQAPHIRMIRDFTADRRRIVARMVIHVMPSPESFQREAGDYWREGARAVYLPHHPERIVVVDGSPETNLEVADLMGAVSAQYLETRMPPLLPWVREALMTYFTNATRRNCMAGLYPPELLKKVKEIFRKPLPLDDLRVKDAASLMAMGEEGSLLCWGYLQYGMHGQDAPVRNMFNKFIRGLVGSGSCAGGWDRAVEEYEAVNKRKFKTKDFENGAKKFWKDQKESKD